MNRYIGLFSCLILLVALTGCVTLSPSGKDMLRNQKAVSELDFALEVQKLIQLYPEFEIEALTVAQPDGNHSNGIHLKKKGAAKTILYFGPNNYPVVRQHANVLPYLAQLNANVIWFDYRGFGFTSGIANLELLKSDAIFLYDAVTELSSLPVVLHGLSIGSILAIQVAANRSVEYLVLEGSVTNVHDWVKYTFVDQAKMTYGVPRPIGYLMRPIFKTKPSQDIEFINNEAVLSEYRGALLMFAGENDWETPPKINAKLFASTNKSSKSEYHVIKNVGHLDILTSEQAISAYKNFFN